MAAHRSRRWAAAAALVILAGCGTDYDQSACEYAAQDQMHAERAWGELLERHSAAHEDGAAHADLDQFIAGARVDVILAEAETRRSCG